MAMRLLVLAVWFVGLAFIAVTPPFEGFDETAHWSYIQQLADTGHGPAPRVDHLSRDVDLYPGPMRYGEVAPFEQTGRLTYRSFHAGGGLGGPTTFAQGRDLNWQSQHPPLYYALSAPVYQAVRGLGWVDHLFALRLFAFVLAFVGYVIGVLATDRYARLADTELGPWTGVIAAAWPFLFPQFFPEFARLGNDSLCLLLASCVFALMLRRLAKGPGWVDAAGVGVLLGLGLLTKAFFAPIAAGVGAVLVLHALSLRHPQAYAQIGATLALTLLIGGGVYMHTFLRTGAFLSAPEYAQGLAASPGSPDPLALLRGLFAIPGSLMWAGTWSLTRLPEVLLVLPGVSLVLITTGYVRRLPQLWRPPSAWTIAEILCWTPALIALPMIAGLVQHVFSWMAGATSLTPGWYLHILAGPLGLAAAMGWRQSWVLTASVGGTLVFVAVSELLNVSLYSGCAAKLGADKHFTFAGASCLIDPVKLSAIAHPGLALAAATVGVAAGVLALSRLPRNAPKEDTLIPF
jgi:hypothetical protein